MNRRPQHPIPLSTVEELDSHLFLGVKARFLTMIVRQHVACPGRRDDIGQEVIWGVNVERKCASYAIMAIRTFKYI